MVEVNQTLDVQSSYTDPSWRYLSFGQAGSETSNTSVSWT